LYTAISVLGGKNVVKAMNRLAMKRSLKTGKAHTVGELVRNAIVQTYGDEFENELSFFDKSVSLKNQSVLKKDVV
jgi:hypothetical protein